MRLQIGDIEIKTDDNNWIVQKWCYSETAVDENDKPKYVKKGKPFYPSTLKQALFIVLTEDIKDSDVTEVEKLIDVIYEVEKNILEAVCK